MELFISWQLCQLKLLLEPFWFHADFCRELADIWLLLLPEDNVWSLFALGWNLLFLFFGPFHFLLKIFLAWLCGEALVYKDGCLLRRWRGWCLILVLGHSSVNLALITLVEHRQMHSRGSHFLLREINQVSLALNWCFFLSGVWSVDCELVLSWCRIVLVLTFLVPSVGSYLRWCIQICVNLLVLSHIFDLSLDMFNLGHFFIRILLVLGAWRLHRIHLYTAASTQTHQLLHLLHRDQVFQLRKLVSFKWILHLIAHEVLMHLQLLWKLTLMKNKRCLINLFQVPLGQQFLAIAIILRSWLVMLLQLLLVLKDFFNLVVLWEHRPVYNLLSLFVALVHFDWLWILTQFDFLVASCIWDGQAVGAEVVEVHHKLLAHVNHVEPMSILRAFVRPIWRVGHIHRVLGLILLRRLRMKGHLLLPRIECSRNWQLSLNCLLTIVFIPTIYTFLSLASLLASSRILICDLVLQYLFIYLSWTCWVIECVCRTLSRKIATIIIELHSHHWHRGWNGLRLSWNHLQALVWICSIQELKLHTKHLSL